jgi:hypothetical protein
MSTTGDYQLCYVAFLDVLGFRQLVERSVDHPALLRQLSGITTLAASPKSGVKQTSLGPCPMQVRAFSDSIVVFSPTQHANGHACNPLAQLCFVVRYLHDRILELDACIRGGITIGKMYWHPSWNDFRSKPKRGSRAAQPITFGPGMNAAYDLENQKGSPPRVLVSEAVQTVATTQHMQAWPFANRRAALHQAFRTDPVDGKVHLDLLSARVVRSQGETMRSSAGGFTVTWEAMADSEHGVTLVRARALAEAGIKANAACKQVRAKYEWLRDYCVASTGDGG